MITLIVPLLGVALHGQPASDPAVFTPAECPFQATFPGPFITSRLPDRGALATQSSAGARRSALCSTAFRNDEATPCQDVRSLSRSIEATRPRSQARWLIAGHSECAREIEAWDTNGSVWRHIVGASGGWVFMSEEYLQDARDPRIIFDRAQDKHPNN